MNVHKNIYIVFFLICSTVFAQNQEVISTITYKSYLAGYYGDNKESRSTLSFLNKISDENPVRFELIYNKTESLYYVQKNMETESIQSRMAKVLMGSNTRSYIDIGEKIYLNQLEAYGETVIVPIEPWTWELTNEKKMIGNYLCLKATTSYILVNPEKEFKKNVEAWYAPEINNSFGPKGFFGLPGLILELTDDKLRYVAEHLNFNSKTSTKIKMPTKGKKISRKELDELGKKMNQKY